MQYVTIEMQNTENVLGGDHEQTKGTSREAALLAIAR